MLAQPLHGHFLAALALAVCAACLFVFYAAQDTSKHNAALLQIPGEGMEYNVGDRVLAGRRIAAPTNQLRYDTEVPYPEENGLGQPRNNHMSWMGTNVAWAGANGGGLGFARLRAPMLYGTETYPYWEEENTGFAEAMMDEYINNCIRKLNPEVGCEGSWDSPAWGTPRDTYDDDHPELDIWPPE